MRSVSFALVLAVLCIDIALVNAGLFIVQPFQGSTCRAGQQCTVSWLDDGRNPLLSAVGVSTVGLYTGRQQLIQTITPVDVSKSQALTFVPDANAGPDSDTYYIAITSTRVVGNDSIPYSAWSPFFRLEGMSGSFDTPLPAATSSIPIPASLTVSQGTLPISTITIGTPPPAPPSPSPSPPAPSPSPATSPTTSLRMTTSIVNSSTRSANSTPTTSPTSPSTSDAPSPSAPATQTGGAPKQTLPLLSCLLSALLSAFCLFLF